MGWAFALRSRPSLAAILMIAATMACAAPSGQKGTVPVERTSVSDPSRTVTLAFRYELTSMSPKTAQAAGGQMQVLFNAGFAILDPKRQAQPLLAERLPQLNTDSWRVLPDGRMETVYPLRPGLTWHDGQPLTADDFVFAWQVYADPGLAFNPRPQDQIEEVVAVDPRTVLIRWKTLFPDAGELAFELVPLPRSILDAPFVAYKQNGDVQAFLNNAYWTMSFVGVGPYRLISWEPGAQLETAAFEGYALGKPKITRLTARIIGDENAVLAAVLADQVQFSVDNAMRFEHGMTLKRDWAASGRGVVLLRTSNTITNMVQFRPEFLKEPALLDRRVRQAMAWSVDKQAIQDGLYEGEGAIALSAMSSDDRFYPDVERSVFRYTYDPRRTEELMAEAGFTRDREGFFASPTGERFRPEFMVVAGTSFERGQAIIADTWSRTGLQVSSTVQSAAQQRDNLARAAFPGIAMQLIGAGNATITFTSSEVGTAANRWSGNNRGGWSNADYDRLFETFNTTLDRTERGRLAVQLMNMVNEEVITLPMYFDVKVTAHVAAIKGPDVEGPLWNIQDWQIT